MIIFSQGTCRIGFPLTHLHYQEKIELIDPHWDSIENEIGDVPPMALGHFHNIHDHLRVFQLLKDDSDVQELKTVLNQISRTPIDPKRYRHRVDWKETWEHCRNRFSDCDIAVIELSSFDSVRYLKNKTISTVKDTVEYMQKIESLTPHCKKLWVCHYRPDIIWNKHSNTRETLYHAISQMDHHFDPSPFLVKDAKLMRDDKHYSPYGIKFIGEQMLEKMESMK